MPSDVRELQVSVRCPSMPSLRAQFNDADHEKPDKEKIPPLDEKYVMETSKSSALFIDEEMDLVSKNEGSCWYQLKHSGMVQWGKRRRAVRFLGNHEKNNLESLSGSVKDTGFDVKEQNERMETTDRKRKKREEEKELTKQVPNEIRTTRKSKRNQSKCMSEAQRLKKAPHGKQNQLVLYRKKKHKVLIDRWSAERYKSAEENILKVMKAEGAVFEKPILRPDLRSEARKLIGDTGLLDHLLKHMAGKVAPGGTERFRRKHNAEGAIEYWLESANLVKIREEAGVQDPYWTPPPGWKPGDDPSHQDPICARQLREIKQEMSQIKHEMQQWASKETEEELAIVTTTNSCLTDNFNSERGGSFVTMQEIYMELVNKKSKIEEQLKDISIALTDMEEQMEMLKSREEPTCDESGMATAALLAAATRVVPVAVAEGSGEEQEGLHEKKAARGEVEGSDEEEEEEMQRPAAEERAAKIERLKSGFRICSQQAEAEAEGAFIWPKATTCPQDDHVVVPTPSSASSSSFPHQPSPLVKPLAERRPISPATLTHVAISLPPPSINLNLNEAPPNLP